MRAHGPVLPLLLVPLLGGCGDNRTHPDPHQPYGPDAAAPLDCVPNLDGRIDSSELRAALGVSVRTLVNPPGTERAVDVVGQVDQTGRLVWDWSTDFADDQVATLAAAPLAGRWYQSSFPGAEFVAPFDTAGTLEAVYTQDAAALWLLGIASAAADPPAGRTLLVYDRPVALFHFPIQPGASWVSTGQIQNGTLRGLPYAGRDTYEGAADAAGALLLPDLTFTQAQRVRLRVTTEPSAGTTVSRRQVSLLFECFGEVARATSRDDEPDDNFTRAVEWRRMGL